MRTTAWIVLFAVLGFAAAVFASKKTDDDKKDDKKGGLPPLVVDKDAPRLTDEPTKKGPKPKADNSACFVCHGNYEEEPFALGHSIDDVGCIDCHGESLAHRDDEDHLTPPDIMYPPEKIAPACKECHETHDAAAVKVLKTWQKCCPKKTFDDILCTDCHAATHRLPKRQMQWDKRTRKVIFQKVKPGKAGGKKETQ